MTISDLEAKRAKPRAKPYKIADEKGLFLLIKPQGGKYWRFNYSFGGKAKGLAFGVYPEVSVREARAKCDDARRLIGEGTDPSLARKTQKLLQTISPDQTFEGIARDWHKQNKERWAPKHQARILRMFEADVFPKIGGRCITDIAAPELLAVLRAIEGRGAIEMAHRTRAFSSQIFRFAIATGKAERNIAEDLRGALKVGNKGHLAHLKEKELPDFLSRLESYDGDGQTRRALKLIIYTLLRTGELRGGRWTEVDFDKSLWEIPPERMKMKEKHIVPLSRQALELLKEQKESSGHGEFIFPSRTSLHSVMSENTMLYALYRMGYHSRATTHGFRSTGSTILNESGFNGDHIERQLAHAERDETRAAYNYAEYLPQRSIMMQWWADYLDACFQTA